MTFWFGGPELEPTPVTRAYLFTLRGGDLLQQLGLGEATSSVGTTPHAGYAECKQAFRQLGLAPLHAFLDREGRSRGTAWVVFPIEATRTGRSKDALMLYAFAPHQRDAVQLSAGGHADVVENPFWMYYFAPLATGRSSTRPWKPQGRVRAYETTLRMPKRLSSTDLETTIRFTPTAAQRALTLFMNPRLAVTGIKVGEQALPFAQWAYVEDGVNPDNRIVVDLEKLPPGEGELALTVTATGSLFEPTIANWVLRDEDTWHPQLDDPEGAIYELTIQVPKMQVPVAPGEKVSDQIAEGVRTVRYRTTRPQNRSTLYVGPFDLYEGDADGTAVEVYADRASATAVGYNPFLEMEVTARNTSRADVTHSRQEIENALKIFKRSWGPSTSRRCAWPALRPDTAAASRACSC